MDNVKFVILIEFVVNFYSFSFYVELILVPIILFVAVFGAFNEVIIKNASLAKVFNFILVGFGLTQLIFVLFNIVNDYKSIYNIENLSSLVLYPLLTILYLPFVYFFALFLKYDTIYRVISHGLKQRQVLIKISKRNIFMVCRFSLRKLKIFHRTSVYKFFDAENPDDVINIFVYFKRFWKKYKKRYLKH